MIGIRRLGMLLAALMWLAASSAALAHTVDARGLFTLEIPENWDDQGANPEGDVEGEHYDLGWLCGPGTRGLNLGLTLYAYPYFDGLCLFDAEDAEIEDFAGRIMEAYKGSKFVSTRRVGLYEIPFVIFYCEDSQYEYLCAVTLANDWLVQIAGSAYADRSYDATRELTEADVDQFLVILDTFEPILKGNAP